MVNPTAMSSCGLPSSYSQFTSDSTITTFNMTANCVFNSWSVPNSFAFLYFTSGEFTINGNGHSIIPSSNGYAILLANAGTVVNLNNVIIEQGGPAGSRPSVDVGAGTRLNANSVIFRNTNYVSALRVSGQAYLKNVQFLSNRLAPTSLTGRGSAITVPANNALARVTDGIFDGNSGAPDVITAFGGGAVELRGCIVFRNNVQADGTTAANNYGTYTAGGLTGAVTDTSVSSGPVCLALTPQPKKKKKADPTPAPTSTPRPAYGASYTALQTATGMTFEATYGLDSGVHFRQLDGAGIGIQSIIDAGYLAALDVYGYVEQGVEVCFPQIGRIIFLDARTMPRAITPLESTVVNGQTCVSINSPGSLVLLPN